MFGSLKRRLVETIPVLISLWIINKAFGLESFWVELLLTPIFLVWLERIKTFDGSWHGLITLPIVRMIPRFIMVTFILSIVPALLIGSFEGFMWSIKHGALTIVDASLFIIAIGSAAAALLVNWQAMLRWLLLAADLLERPQGERAQFFALWFAAVGLAYLVMTHLQG
jgi:hypothetical protein